MLVVYTADLARGSPLIIQSLLGANPIFGSRYYGLGNEMEAGLPIILFAGLAALLPARSGTRRDFGVFVGAGLLLTFVAAFGRFGADVGAIFTIGGGTAAGAVMLLPGGPTLRAGLLAVGAPVAGLFALAGLDLATGAGGHFTTSVLHASSIGDVVDTLGRRLELAWQVLQRGLMPVDVVLCALAITYAIKYRRRWLAPVGGSAMWRACFVAGAVGSLVGSLANDSGPLLLVIGVFSLACVAAYLRGDPRLEQTADPSNLC
jgi:hypothetical protein